MKKPLKRSAHPHILIIGGGFGGIELAKKLKNAPAYITLLDRHNYHTFQPLLYQVATGGLEADSIAFPLRRIFKKQDNLRFRMAEVLAIHTQHKLVHTSIGSLRYDYLIIATGSTTNFFGQAELAHFAMPMKTIPEALNLRSMLLQNLEAALIEHHKEKKAALLTFVVVGGGPTGVELSGALAELKKHVLSSDYPELNIKEVHIYLIEGSDKVLNGMSAKASKKAAEFLQQMGVEIWCNQRVLNYNGTLLKLASGTEMATKNVLWSAGVSGEVPKGIPTENITRGQRIAVDEINRVQGFQSVFAIGDVAFMEVEGYPNGLPGIAPVAIQQGKQLARNLKHLLAGRATETFRYRDKGTMATIGRNRAVVDMGRIRFQGIFAWFVWMFVHLMTLVGFRNKLVVLVNWVWNYFSYDRGTRLIIRKFVLKPLGGQKKRSI
ncbi:MAG: NAD(P)/FAD-dependent oxidoreductase [Sphingobacteriaceae bacterium]